MVPGKLCSREATQVSSRGAWAGRGLFTVAVHALPGHLPLSQAPAIRPSGVTALASVKSWRAKPRSAPDASWEGQGPPPLPGHLALLVEEGPLGLVSG